MLHQRRHADVAAATNIDLPSEQQEAEDPAGADTTYEAAVHLLREKTRNETDHPLVKAEVTNYGYRRNLYACRPYGITLAAIVLIVEVTLAVLGWQNKVDVPVPLMLAAAGVTLIWLGAWVAVVSPAFVRRDADRYADALLIAASNIAP